MQDLQLGTLVALMPFFSDRGGGGGGGRGEQWRWGVQLLQVVLGFAVLLVAVRGLSMRAMERFYRCTIVYCVDRLQITCSKTFQKGYHAKALFKRSRMALVSAS